jgi:hypothetical protein
LLRPLYRARQVRHALRPRVHPDHFEDVTAVLNEAQQMLFFEMELRDQRHAVEVLHRLRRRGAQNPDLQVAALLHDCGKGAVPLWLRIAKVAAPWAVERAAIAGAKGWRGAAYRLAHHPSLGADSVAATGASATTVRLIAGRIEAQDVVLWALLQTADDAS